MRNKLVENIIDAYKSVMPIAIFVVIIGFCIPLSNATIFSFAIASVLLIFGIAAFTTGAEMSIVEIGKSIGNFLARKGSKKLIVFASLIMGIVITISEPDLMVLAKEISSIPAVLIISLVALGIGVFLALGVYRIIKRFPYRMLITFSLMLIMVLLYFTKEEFIAISFDAAGVTTGPMSVPVIVAFGYGIARMRNDKDSTSDTFGLCGLASLGPVIALLFLGLFFKTSNTFNTSGFVSNLPALNRFINSAIVGFKDIIIALSPIILVYIISIIFGNKVKKKNQIKIIFGIVLTVVGLTLFLTGVSGGFIEMGYLIGQKITLSNYKNILIPIGMILGYVIINAEPAIKILNRQISDLTEGSISPKMINLCLSIGVSLAVGFSLFRVLYGVSIFYIIVPGYFLAALLMYYTPKMFVTVAYDSGGAACGAMTTSFLLPMCIGVCTVMGEDVLSLAFGIGSLVCLMPIIIIQILGIIYDQKLKATENNIFDEEIIDYVWES